MRALVRVVALASAADRRHPEALAQDVAVLRDGLVEDYDIAERHDSRAAVEPVVIERRPVAQLCRIRASTRVLTGEGAAANSRADRR